jgi:PilZ domain
MVALAQSMDFEHERRTPRYPFAAPAEVIVEQTGAQIDARVKELSQYGCYLDALTSLSPKTSVLVKIFSPKDYFEAPATVIYSNPTLGMGIAFRSLKPNFQAVLQKWLLQATTENRDTSLEGLRIEGKGGTSSSGDYVRTGQRVNSRVAVALEWTEEGRSLRIEGHTIDVGPYGCLLLIPAGILVGQKVRLINLVSQKECEAIVVRQGPKSAAGWEFGLHLKNPSDEFWELNL